MIIIISFRHKGDFSKTKAFLSKLKNPKISCLEKYGKMGVEALSSATPVDTGLTSQSWYYEIKNQNGVITLNFCNSNINDNVPIAIILQYGHGTNNGGWVEGIDYINPAIQPIFNKIADEAWKEVTKL